MININECKKHLKNIDLTDKQISDIRDVIYMISERTLDENLKFEQKFTGRKRKKTALLRGRVPL